MSIKYETSSWVEVTTLELSQYSAIAGGIWVRNIREIPIIMATWPRDCLFGTRPLKAVRLPMA